MTRHCRLELGKVPGLPPVARVETGDRPAPDVAAETIAALCDEAETLGAATLLVRSRALLEGELPALSTWEVAGFRKIFVRSLGRRLTLPPGDEPARQAVPPAALERYRAAAARALDRPVVLCAGVEEWPFIQSFDLVSPGPECETPDLVCYAHAHPLSGAIYLEKIALAPPLQGGGIGTAVVAALMDLARDWEATYVYLLAKADAEPFWQRRGFAPLGRLNLRARRRRREALRKRPGWDVARVLGQRLERPVWQYRNHPGDDLDLLRGLMLYGADAGAFQAPG
ncbi:MAG TPA: GNAT family N-acetyltransferase [Limnochordia bacterium]|nr:GNAT family N-acetyltransferase [Limnochordia bacterium]